MMVGSSVQPSEDISANPQNPHLVENDDRFLDVEVADGFVPPPAPSRAYQCQLSPYISGQGLKRYQGALRNLIPIRKGPVKTEDIGVDKAGLFSFVFYTWISQLMLKASRKGLCVDDIPNGSPAESCNHNVQRLEMLWQDEIVKYGPTGASLLRAVWRFVCTRLYCDWLAYTVSYFLGFLTPIVFMRKLLEFAEDPEADIMTGLTWAIGLGLCEFLRIIFFSWRWALSFRTGTRLRSACLALLYRKLVRLNHFDEKAIGQLINIFANDSQRIFDMMMLGPMIIGGPIVMLCGISYVYLTLGPWALSGIMVFIVFYPIQYGISRLCGLLRSKTVVISDERISLTSEILTCIKLIKMYAWEDCFEKDIERIREKEKLLLEKTSYLTSFSISSAPAVPIVSAIVTFLAHLGSGNTLSAAQAFPIQGFFSNNIRSVVRVLQGGLLAFHEARVGLARIQAFPLIALINSIVRNSLTIMQIGALNTMEAIVGFKRITRCLLMEELTVRIQRPIDRTQAISIGAADFSWDVSSSCSDQKSSKKKLNVKDEDGSISKLQIDHSETQRLNPKEEQSSNVKVLFSINFNVKKGHLVGVCGPVGSGKTSLLLSILGQMRLTCGQLARDGSCAYVSQQAWITNSTLQENILFGEAFSSKRYYNIIHCCALKEDIETLPGGDQTEIGERGINLSGGQKQRVSLARAVYANRDIYLLDDPLSAIDVNISTHVFESCIIKELKGKSKTVVLVTHQIQYLRECDEIYFLKEGRITERGSHEKLVELGKDYAAMVTQNDCEASSHDGDLAESSKTFKNVVDLTGQSEIQTSQTVKNKHEMHGGRLTVDEPSHLGKLKADTYFTYISLAGGYFPTIMVLLAFLVSVGSSAFSSWWLATWINAGGGNTTMEVNNRTIRSTNMGDNPDFNYYQNIYCSALGLILITTALRCLVFTKATLQASSMLHKKLFEKIIHSPMLFFESNPSGRLQNLFSRDMDEVDSRLPPTVENIIQNIWILAFAVMFICIVFPWFIIAFIPLALVFYIICRIFRKGVRDLKRLENSSRSPVFSCILETVQGLNTIRAFNKEGDYIQRFFKIYDDNSTCSYLWNIAMRWLAVRIDCLAVAVMSITSFLVVILHGVVAPAMAGLALSYSWHISGVLQFTVRLISETEVRFISVERILGYMQSTDVEGNGKVSKVSPKWPDGGAISFLNVRLSYRSNTPAALDNVSFNILGSEKIGIVGRTGSGKSSLVAALFRLVELSGGRIKLDGVDISSIPLQTLRSKISVIPQDPVLFSGTVRSNLDPEGFCSDEQLWKALEKTKLHERISCMPDKLASRVGAAQTSLSLGERQLLCLARALLRNNKILVLDEATASVDPETEKTVQGTIQREFQTSTVLIIAHRLATVTSCDRILVMEHGKVVEFDETSALLSDSSSMFSQMVASGEARFKEL